MATLDQLLTVKTPLQNFESLLTTLATIGFPNTTNWTTGTVPNALLQTIGWGFTDIQDSRFKFAAGGLLDYAAIPEDQGGPGRAWLELHADQVFNNQPFPATAAVVEVEFTDAANLGPFTIGPGGAGVSIGQGQPIYRTTNTANVILPLGGTVMIPVRAPQPGVSGNVPDGSLTFFAAGVLPGVTVNNPGPGSVIVAGTDSETNQAIANRCRTKWGLLGTGSPYSAYINWALYAGQGQVGKARAITNVDLTDPGRVDLYLASPAGGGVAPAVVTAVQAFIDPPTVGGERTSSRIPETAKCVVHTCVTRAIAIEAVIAVWPEYNSPTFKAQIAADIAAYQASFPIGGNAELFPFPKVVPYTRIVQLLLNRSGVAQGPAQEIYGQVLTLNGLTTSVPLDPFDAPVFDITGVTFVSVPRVT